MPAYLVMADLLRCIADLGAANDVTSRRAVGELEQAAQDGEDVTEAVPALVQALTDRRLDIRRVAALILDRAARLGMGVSLAIRVRALAEIVGVADARLWEKDVALHELRRARGSPQDLLVRVSAPPWLFQERRLWEDAAVTLYRLANDGHDISGAIPRLLQVFESHVCLNESHVALDTTQSLWLAREVIPALTVFAIQSGTARDVVLDGVRQCGLAEKHANADLAFLERHLGTNWANGLAEKHASAALLIRDLQEGNVRVPFLQRHLGSDSATVTILNGYLHWDTPHGAQSQSFSSFLEGATPSHDFDAPSDVLQEIGATIGGLAGKNRITAKARFRQRLEEIGLGSTPEEGCTDLQGPLGERGCAGLRGMTADCRLPLRVIAEDGEAGWYTGRSLRECVRCRSLFLSTTYPASDNSELYDWLDLQRARPAEAIDFVGSDPDRSPFFVG